MSPDRSPSREHALDALQILQAVAAPVMQVTAEGVIAWANDAAADELGARPGNRFESLWSTAVGAEGLRSDGDDATELRPRQRTDRAYGASRRLLADGSCVLTLHRIDALLAARTEIAERDELLDLARDFGRLGVWQRNVRTLQGHWDREVRRFWGLNPDESTPDFLRASESILQPDRDIQRELFTRSIRSAGRYSVRYRVRGFDGVVRRIHSQWLVKNGADGQPERVLGLMMDDSEPYELARTASELESQLALALELGGIGLWRHDLATDRLHLSAKGWDSLALPRRSEGMRPSELWELTHPDDRARVEESARQALITTVPVDVEARFRRVDGQWRPHLVRRTVVRDDSGRPTAFLGVALDITERLESRRLADELARRFESVTRTAGIGYWVKEPDQERATWSGPLRAMLALPPTAPVPRLGEFVREFVHPDDAAEVKKALTAWRPDRNQNLGMSLRVAGADGRMRDLFCHTMSEVGPSGPLLFGIVIDLTERRRSEMALRRAEQQIALAARAAGVGTWGRNLLTGEDEWDEQMWRLRGHPPQPRAMTDAERMACVHPDDRDATWRVMSEALSHGGTVDFHFRVVWPDGQVRWLASRSMEVDEPGAGRRRIGVNWDITASHTAEDERREREMAQRESASKSRLMARISHELRTPLNAVLGFAQLLQDDERADDSAGLARRRRIGHILTAGRHLLSLVNDVLDLTGLEGGEIRIVCEPLALRPLIEQVLPLLAPMQAERQVKIELGAIDATVVADGKRLQQVVVNLLSNAVKYNRPGGVVQVSALSRGEAVALRVADTGCGMTEAQMRQMFEPFNRLGADAGAVEGSGIGLAIVRTLVERMGGRITVDSIVDVGSVFEVELVAVAQAGPAAAVAAQAASPAAAPVSRVGRKVLYIEDNPVNALIMGELMARRRDIAFDVSPDGSSGVRRARALRPDLILLDMQLPDIDGFEVMRLLRADPTTAAIPCVALSANAIVPDVERARAAGVRDYWTKPLDFAAFMAALDGFFGAEAPAEPRTGAFDRASRE